MNGHLEKAKGAIAQAAELVADAGDQPMLSHDKGLYLELMDIAAVQAAVAGAQAMESIARSLEKIANPPVPVFRDGIKITRALNNGGIIS